MCGGDYPNPKEDLKPRRLIADRYLSAGNTYLVPELSLNQKTADAYNRGVVVFVFETPNGKKLRVPVGSIVKCISLAEVEE